MCYNGMTLEELAKEFYLIPKNVKYENLRITSEEELKILLEEVDDFSNTYDKEQLKNIYIVKQKREKKLSQEEVKIIKEDKGSVREKAKKYNISIGTVSKINNDKY